MKQLKKIITNVWAIVIFCTTGGGYTMYELLYAGPKRDVEEWVKQYGETAIGEATYEDGILQVKWDMMKVPPTGRSYTVVPYVATKNLSTLASLPSSVQIAGIWGKAQTAKDWEDFSRIRYIGGHVKVPDHLQNPGTYTLIYYILIQTKYGLYQAELTPVFYTIE